MATRRQSDTAKPLQQRALITRAKLMTVGLQAFTELGHDGTNVQVDIMDVAGVSPSSFYHQFKDKTELLLAILDDASNLRRNSVIGQLPETPVPIEQAVRELYERLLDSVATPEHGWRAQLHVQWVLEPRIHAFVLEQRLEWFARLTEFFEQTTSIDRTLAERAARTFFGFSFGFAMTYLDLTDAERQKRRSTLIDDAVTVMIGGLTGLIDPPN